MPRKPYQPCTTHTRIYCGDPSCKQEERDNAGSLNVTTNGDLAMGIGNGLAIDLETGDLGMQIAPGIVVDF